MGYGLCDMCEPCENCEEMNIEITCLKSQLVVTGSSLARRATQKMKLEEDNKKLRSFVEYVRSSFVPDVVINRCEEVLDSIN